MLDGAAVTVARRGAAEERAGEPRRPHRAARAGRRVQGVVPGSLVRVRVAGQGHVVGASRPVRPRPARVGARPAAEKVVVGHGRGHDVGGRADAAGAVVGDQVVQHRRAAGAVGGVEPDAVAAVVRDRVAQDRAARRARGDDPVGGRARVSDDLTVLDARPAREREPVAGAGVGVDGPVLEVPVVDGRGAAAAPARRPAPVAIHHVKTDVGEPPGLAVARLRPGATAAVEAPTAGAVAVGVDVPAQDVAVTHRENRDRRRRLHRTLRPVAATAAVTADHREGAAGAGGRRQGRGDRADPVLQPHQIRPHHDRVNRLRRRRQRPAHVDTRARPRHRRVNRHDGRTGERGNLTPRRAVGDVVADHLAREDAGRRG